MLPVPEAPNAGRFIQQQIEALRRKGLDVDVLLVNRREKGMLAYAGLPAMLRQAIALSKPDLVHVMYGGIMSWLVTHLVRDRPVVVTFHGSDLLGQPFERPVRRFLSACGVVASRQAAKWSKGIVVVADHLIKSLSKDISTSQIRVIPCGIDPDLFQPLERALCRDRLGWAPASFHVIFQDTGDPVKRADLALSTIERLKGFGVRAEIHLLRGVQYEQVPIWLNASNALLLTSHHEGSPTIVKEALACNLPIVSVAVGDVAQRIHGIEGCHLSDPDPTQLAEKLRLISSRTSRIDARKSIGEFCVDYCAVRLMKFYEEILREGK
jgi:glycosyltransferase involved in cell wall biosynthesis